MPQIGEHYIGIYQSPGSGRGRGGFVVLETPGIVDVFVPFEDAGTALHGDQVRVEIHQLPPGRAPVGQVVDILRHANKQIVGQIRRDRKRSIVTPKNPRIRRLIEIPQHFKPSEVPDGAWVMVEITDWSRPADQPLRGKFVEMLGLEGDRRLPILLLIRGEGVLQEFPAEIEAAAEKIAKSKIGEQTLAARRDFRSDRVFTIDPVTAKDFDDAISLVEKTGSGWRVAVHIADVSHYVKTGGKIDTEAYERGTSVYPVDRVIPMLPEALSNSICSLRPGEEKLTVTAIFTVSQRGKLEDIELCNSAIHSVRRFTYEEAQGLLDQQDGVEESRFEAPQVAQAVLEDLMALRAASAALRRERERRGSLDLDLSEPEIVFDEEGEVEDVRRRDRFEAHRLIEDLMVAANEAVAVMLTKAKLPILYRVHEPPQEKKFNALRPAFARFGIHLPDGEVDHAMFQSAIHQAAKHPAGEVVQRWILRAMARAVYQPTNLGHYGLASECYAHFTSPIRRYPDLIVHRAVKAFLGSEQDRKAYREACADSMREWGRHVSEREQKSQKIEWDAEKILSYEFMRRHLGSVFEAFISGVMGKGFFVELKEYPVEGFVPIRSLDDDFYDLDDQGLVWTGRRTHRAYGIGNLVKVQIERVDPMAGEMDLHLVRREGHAGRRKSVV